MSHKLSSLAEYIDELKRITHEETGTQYSEIEIDEVVAKSWYEDNVAPYYCFRETWGGGDL